MMKTLFAALAAVAFLAAAPAYACNGDCASKKMAAADSKDAKPAGCACNAATKGECKCGEKCACGHCAAHKKADEKKS